MIDRPRTVLEALRLHGHDHFEPSESGEPTRAPPSTSAKVEALRRRIELGLPLWHEEDRADHEGDTGIKPREKRQPSAGRTEEKMTRVVFAKGYRE